MKLMGMVCEVAVLAFGALSAQSQETLLPAQAKPVQLTEQGQVLVAGRSTPYLIRHLPVSSFPELPVGVVGELNRRGCTIPQTYQARRPENVVHASLEHAGSSDWAVLCSVEGTVSLLVFFDGGESREQQAMVLVTAQEKERLQVHPGNAVLGFNWGIDPASPQQVHDAQNGMEKRPARVDHDALADSVVDQGTVFHFYSKSEWILLEKAN